MSSSTMSPKVSGLISAQDLLKLMKTNGKSSFMRVKPSGNSFMHTNKWKQRFIILANNEIYVYENEMAKKPSTCIPLLGYNRVKRYESDKYPWSFSLMPAVSSIKTRVYACTTDEERRQWMRKIKDHLYRTNDIERPMTDELDQLTSGSEQEYLDLEEPVFSPPEASTADEEKDDFSDADEFEDGDEPESDATVMRKLPHRKASIDSQRDLPVIPRLSHGAPPPRYSSLDPAHEYQNLPQRREDESDEGDRKGSVLKSRFDACMITDPALERDRDACRKLIQSKSCVGVYLLRKSRQDDNLVLVVSTSGGDVKEYRLEEKDSLYRLTSKTNDANFEHIEILLERYAHTMFLPGINTFITYGIFECEEEKAYADLNDFK